MFVTFKEEKYALEYRSNYPHTFLTRLYVNIKNFFIVTLCGCCYDKKVLNNYKQRQKITVDWAPEPEDIIFANLEFKWIDRFLRSLVLYIISILLMGASFGIVLTLNHLQYKSEKKSENNLILKYGISFAITGVTSAINAIVKMLFQSFSEKEKMWTYTDKYLSFSVKLTIFTFFNSAIIPLLTNYIEFGWDSHENLVNNMLTTFLSGSLLAPIMSLICYDLILNQFWIWFYVTRKYDNEKEPLKEFTQEELNLYFERPDMGISVQYSNLAKQVCMCMIYIPIFPLGVPITLIGIILNYFVEKFKCIYVYKRPEMLNQSICFFYMDYFCVALFCYAIGDYVFFSDTHSNKFFELFNIVFYAVLFIIPYNILLRKWNSSASDKYENLISYDDAYFGFSFDYERINPKTQKKGMINYLVRIYDKGLIEKEELEYCINNIDKINLRETFYMNSRTKSNNVMKLNNMDSYNENKNLQNGFHINQHSEEHHVNAENEDIQVNTHTQNNIRNFMNNFQFLIEQKELYNVEEQEKPNNIDNDNKANDIQPKFIQNINKPRFRPFEFNSMDLFNKKRERRKRIFNFKKKMSKK
jgi:MFS family permease